MGDPRWKDSLNAYLGSLRTGLAIGTILHDLRPLLTDTEYSRIEEEESSVERVDELVKILLEKDRPTFDNFCSVLGKNGYSRWACRLTGKGLLSQLRIY